MVDIMKKKIILSVCAAVAMAFSLPSQAQRLIPKQRGIEVVGSVPLIKGEKFLAADNFGMGASLARYLGHARLEELSVCWIWASATTRRKLHGRYDGTAGRLPAPCRPLEML